MNTNMNKKGFSLLELLIVISIMIVMTTIVVANYYGMMRSSSLTSASTTLSDYLLMARQNAIMQKKGVVFYIENPTNYTVCSLGQQEISAVTNSPLNRLYFDFCKLDIPDGTVLHKLAFDDYPITVINCDTGMVLRSYIDKYGDEATVFVPTTYVDVSSIVGWNEEDKYCQQDFSTYLLPNGIVFDLEACSNLSAIIFYPDGTIEGNPSLPYVNGAWQLIVKEKINTNNKIIFNLFHSGKISCDM